jgi:uncharacterized protein
VDATGTRLRLRVTPRARRREIVGRYGDGWKVRVVAPPSNGRANEETLELVASALAVKRESVALVAGGSSREKVVRVSGLTANDAERRLVRAAAGTERR